MQQNRKNYPFPWDFPGDWPAFPLLLLLMLLMLRKNATLPSGICETVEMTRSEGGEGEQEKEED